MYEEYHIGGDSYETTNKMTPSQVMILAKYGTTVSEEEAKVVLKFISKVAKITGSRESS